MYFGKKILALLGLTAFGIAFAGEMSPTELQLREWRMITVHLNAEMVPEFAGKKFPVKVNFPVKEGGKSYTQIRAPWLPPVTGDPKSKNGKLEFSAVPIHSPLDSWIPPYIGTSAKEIRFSLLPEKVRGNISASLRLEFLDCTQSKPRILMKKLSLAKKGKDQWTEFAFPVKTDLYHRLSCITLVLNRPDTESSCDFAMTTPVIVTREGDKYELLNPEMPSLRKNTPKGLKYSAKKLPQRNKLYIGFAGPWWIYRNYAFLPELSRFMKTELPDLDIVLSLARSPEPCTGEFLKNLPEDLYYQFQFAQHGITYPTLFGALPKNEKGEMQNFRFNSIWALHPIILNGLKEQFDYAADLGINSFKVFDYVWPYRGGRWGYDDTSIATFRRDLSCKDEGLHILVSKDKVKTIHFPDYFRSIHGMMPSPQDLGLKSWDEYVPVKTKDLESGIPAIRLNYSILLALCSYEWLHQAQRWNTWAKSYGGTFEYLLNNEGWNNGGDYIYLMRLADSGIISKEFFIATPSPFGLGSIYSASGLYTRTAARIGREMGYCCENSTGGGQKQPYWDAKVAYSVSYMVAALGLRHMHHDHHDHDHIFSKWFDPESGNAYAGVALMMSQGRALQQALRDQVGKPEQKSTVLNVRYRSVGVNVPGMAARWILYGEWRPVLLDSSIDYEETDPEELPLMLPKAGVVFYAPHATRKDSADQLTAWLKEGKNRTLVLHSVVPFRQEKGYAVAERIVKEDIPADAPSLFPGFAKGTMENGTVLMKKSDGSPLLSEYKVSEGGKILYLHPAPEKCGKSDLKKVMAYLTEKLELPLRQMPESNALVLPFEGKGSSVYILWNSELAAKAYSQCAEWEKKFYHAKRRYHYDHRDILYSWYQAGTVCKAKVRVKKPGTYRLYSFLADRETVAEVGSDHLLPLSLDEALTEVIYAAPDTPEFRSEIAKLRKERTQTARFFRWSVDR